MKEYVLTRCADGRSSVIIHGDGSPRALPDGRDVWDFGGGQFNWGAQTRGTDQLALAILLDATWLEGVSIHYWAAFAKSILSIMPHAGGVIEESYVLHWLVMIHDVGLSYPTQIRLASCLEN